MSREFKACTIVVVLLTLGSMLQNRNDAVASPTRIARFDEIYVSRLVLVDQGGDTVGILEAQGSGSRLTLRGGALGDNVELKAQDGSASIMVGRLDAREEPVFSGVSIGSMGTAGRLTVSDNNGPQVSLLAMDGHGEVTVPSPHDPPSGLDIP